MDWRQDLRRVAFTLCEESRLQSTLHIQRPPLGSRLGGTDRCTLAVSCQCEEKSWSTCRPVSKLSNTSVPSWLVRVVIASCRPTTCWLSSADDAYEHLCILTLLPGLALSTLCWQIHRGLSVSVPLLRMWIHCPRASNGLLSRRSNLVV